MAGCSTRVVTIWRLPGLVARAERMAVLSLSVPQLVKMISSGPAPSRAATCSRACLRLPAHLAPEGVHAGGVAVQVVKIRQHGLQDFRGHLGGGIVVQIDGGHWDTSSTSSSGQTNSRSLASTKSFRVRCTAAQEAQAPRVATSTWFPTTSMSSRSPPSCCRAGLISRCDGLFDHLDLLEVGELRRAGGRRPGRARTRSMISWMAS